ncbi:response regulator transcription factor [Chloroflexota bacterium]
MTTVAIADDHAIVRRNLRALIEDELDLVVVGEAGSGLEAIHLVGELSPDILVLDMILGDITGIEATCHVRKEAPETSVIIYSMYGNEDYVLGARQAGAKGYVLKESPASELLKAIRVVSAGGRYFAT